VRGDAKTVARHLKAIGHSTPSIAALYKSAGLHALDIARRRGLDLIDTERVRQALLARE
jgi:predicted short-subunit dehydrogenase-like oxidoreductase (DUF2520 family)